jgi:glycosyltransferase involved in cell wall biosynthesis
MHYCFITLGTINTHAGYIRARHLGRALCQRGVRVSYVIDDYPENHPADVDSRAELAYIARKAKGIKQRRRAVRELAPDFVEVLNPTPKSLLAIAGLRRPKIVGVWDEPLILHDCGFVRNRLNVFLDGWLHRHADVRVVCTRKLQSLFLDRWKQRALYMPHAMYLPEFPSSDSPFVLPTVVYMGSFYPVWDHDLLFEAFVLLAQEGIKPPIQMIGTGPDLPRWKAFCEQHGLDNVTFPGFMTGPELWRRLQHAHALLFPIRPTFLNECRCPSKTLAYAQAHRPIITNRVGEVAVMLGDKAIYVEPTPHGFASAIRDACLAQKLPDIDYGIEKHNWGARADDLLAELNLHLPPAAFISRT